MRPSSEFFKGLIAVLPLSVAVVPWGILAGSFAMDIGMNMLEGQAMSALVFAGSAQLVAMGMLKSGIGIGSILLTVLFISARHFLYGISFRQHIQVLPLKWRLTFGFLMTDELFALCHDSQQRSFRKWYAFGVGLGFYLAWNIASFVGIVIGNQIPNIEQYGLEFAVAATFIAIVVPMILTRGQLCCVLTASILSVIFSFYEVNGGLIIASILAMLIGYWVDNCLMREVNHD